MRLSKTILRSTASLAVLGALTAAANAQQASGELQEVVVTGYRASLAKAIDVKRNADQVVDVISAEDIGKFPDKNVADALQRITGVTITRDFGEGEKVSIRGTAPNLNLTLMNGHSVATADWFILDQLNSNRSFNYTLLPSELVGTLEVQKSPSADIEEGGVGGTVNVITRKPLDLKSFTFEASAEAVHSALPGKTDPQLSGLVSWKNADDTFGILISGVWQKRHLRRDGLEVLSYEQHAIDDQGGKMLYVPQLIGSSLFQQVRDRKGVNADLQWKPNETLEINLSGMYSYLKANNFNQNYMMWGTNLMGDGADQVQPTDTKVQGDVLMAGTFPNSATRYGVVFDAIDRIAHTKTNDVDLDIKWTPNDDWAIHTQVGYTQATGATDLQPFWETQTHTGVSYDLTGKLPMVNFTDIDPTDANALDTLGWASSDIVTNKDREFYFHGDVQRNVDFGVIKYIKAGVKFTQHKRSTEWDPGRVWSLFDGMHDLSTVAGDLTPSDYLDGLGDTTGVLHAYRQVDPAKLQDVIENADGRVNYLYPYGSFTIKERALGGFLMAGFEGEGFHGNVGVRVVQTRQTAVSWNDGVTSGISNPFSPTGFIAPLSVTRTYTDILPSANIAFDLTDKLILRFAAARVMARPDYGAIAPQVSTTVLTKTATGGNPDLDPYRANQFDVSLEYYPSKNALMSAAFFYKDIASYVETGTTTQVIPVEITDPAQAAGWCTAGSSANIYNCSFSVSSPINGAGGTNKGIELSWQQGIWGGFGFLANYTYSSAKSSDGAPVIGNSTHSGNLTGYYEDSRLSARLSWNYRSHYYMGIDRGTPLYEGANKSLDASISYEVYKGVSLTFNAVNLLDNKLHQYGWGDASIPRAFYDNGRQYYFGVRFKY